MATNKIPVHILQAYLAQTPPDTEVDLNKLVTEIQETGMQQALTFFSTFSEPKKLQYMSFLYNYYFYILTDGEWLYELVDSEGNGAELVQEIEDNFIIKYNLNTTELVPLRKLISRLQKEVAKQRIYKKEEVVEVMSDNTDS